MASFETSNGCSITGVADEQQIALFDEPPSAPPE